MTESRATERAEQAFRNVGYDTETLMSDGQTTIMNVSLAGEYLFTATITVTP